MMDLRFAYEQENEKARVKRKSEEKASKIKEFQKKTASGKHQNSTKLAL